MNISHKRLLVITLTLMTFSAMFATPRSTFSTEQIDVDNYCWIEGDHMDMGFSKYGEMIGYDEDTETGLGIQYPGYESAGTVDAPDGTYDQKEDSSVDPFCNEYVGVDWWMNGWFIDIKFRVPSGENREIWAFAMFSDGVQHGGDWIVMPSVPSYSSARPLWQEHPPYANPDSYEYAGIVDPIPPKGGRKTNGLCTTDPIKIVYNGPGKFEAVCRTRISEVGGAVDLVDLTFTFIFNKAQKNVIIQKDVKRLYTKQPMNIQFGNRGEWDLGFAGDTDSYTHWYTSEPVQYWDTDGDGAINETEVETTWEDYKDYFLTNKHPEKWWDEVPDEERPTQVFNEHSEATEVFPETWLEAQEGTYGLEGHMDPTVKENSYAVAQVIASAGDYVGALAVWPHPEFWSAANTYFPPVHTKYPQGNNPNSIPLMLAPISRMLEWHKWTYDEDPYQTADEEGITDRDDVWVTADDFRYPSGSTLEPTIPFVIYEHDFELSSTLPEYRVVSAYVLTDYHDADDADADVPGNEESWSSGLNVIDWEIQQQLDRIFISLPLPVASFTHSPKSPVVNQMVTFNASASHDPDGTIVSYFWDFGDGTNGTGEIITHVYTTVDTYTVTLTVTDNDGLHACATTSITVSPQFQPPVASFTYSPVQPLVDQIVTFDASASYDPDGTIVSYDWDFGDETNGTGIITTHAYTTFGTYTVTLIVTDNDGLTDWASTNITVPAPEPPIASFTWFPAILLVGEEATFTSTSTDPDGTIVSWEWDFNNDAITDATTEIATWTYDATGIVTITLTVTDDDGLFNGTAKNVTVACGIIYIRADGSVDPSTAPILRDGDLYTLTDNIFSGASGIVIERNNMTLDGAGYTLQGTKIQPFRGIELEGRSNVTIRKMKIVGFMCGINLELSSNNTISGSYVANSYYGIYLHVSSSNNSISGNNITANHDYGILLEHSSNNNSICENYIAHSWLGIVLRSSNNTSISGNNITANGDGLGLWSSSNNSIYENNITNNNHDGIILGVSSINNALSGNNVSANYYGIFIGSTSNNALSGNNITASHYGIYLYKSTNTTVYHNNFKDNFQHVRTAYSGYTNVWDDGYPSGGNYWSHYTGVDELSGPYQNETGSDGIGDTSRIIDGNNQDNYPLMEPWIPAPSIPTTIDELKTEIEELGSEDKIDNQGIVTSLLAKLNVAQKLVEDGKIAQAENILNAFISEVQAQSGKHITPDAAELLIVSVEYILSNL